MSDTIRPIRDEALGFIERDFQRIAGNIRERQIKHPEISKVVFLSSDYFRMTCRTDFKEGYSRALKSIYAQTDSLLGISPWDIKLRQATPALFYLELEAAIP